MPSEPSNLVLGEAMRAAALAGDHASARRLARELKARQERGEMSIWELNRMRPGDVRPPEQVPGERHAEDVGAGLDQASRDRLLEAGALATAGLGGMAAGAALGPAATAIPRSLVSGGAGFGAAKVLDQQ